MNTTTDLFFAAYLKLKGIKMSNFEFISERKIKFVFEIDNAPFKALKMEYINSECHKIRQTIDELKSLRN